MHGPIKLHHAPGLIDAQCQAWHFIQADHVNLTMTEALRVAPKLAAEWLRWQARHIGSTGAGQGVVFDHWVRGADLHVSACCCGCPMRGCRRTTPEDGAPTGWRAAARTAARPLPGCHNAPR